MLSQFSDSSGFTAVGGLADFRCQLLRDTITLLRAFERVFLRRKSQAAVHQCLNQSVVAQDLYRPFGRIGLRARIVGPKDRSRRDQGNREAHPAPHDLSLGSSPKRYRFPSRAAVAAV